MANNISFNIGSKFSGEGFKKASQAIKDNSREIEASRRGLGELSNALGEVSPGATKAVNAISDVANALKQVGIVGGGIQLGIMAISEAIKITTDIIERSKEAVKHYAEEFTNNLVFSMEMGIGRVNEMTENMTRLTKSTKEFSDAFNLATDRQAKDQIYKLHIDTLQKMTDDMSQTAKNVILAEEAYHKAIITTTAAHEMAADKLDVANKARDRAIEIERAASEEMAKAVNKANIARANRDIGVENLTKVEEAEKNAIAAHEKAVQNATAAKIAAEKASYAAIDAERALEIAELEGAQKLKDAMKKKEEEDAKIAKAKADAVAAAEEAEWEHKEWIKNKMIPLYNKQIKTKEASDAAEAELTEKTKELARKRESAALSEGGGSSGEDSSSSSVKGIVKVDVVKGIKGVGLGVDVNQGGLSNEMQKPKKLDDATWERYKKGTATVADTARVKRFQEMDQRYAMQEMKRLMPDAVRFVQNAQKPASWLSDFDRKHMDLFKSTILPKLGPDMAKTLLGDASKKVLNTEVFKSEIKNITKYLQNLGLQ